MQFILKQIVTSEFALHYASAPNSLHRLQSIARFDLADLFSIFQCHALLSEQQLHWPFFSFFHSAKLSPVSAYLNMLFLLPGILLFLRLADSCCRSQFKGYFLVTLNTDQVLCCVLSLPTVVFLYSPSLTLRLWLCVVIPSNRCSPYKIHKGSVQGCFSFLFFWFVFCSSLYVQGLAQSGLLINILSNKITPVLNYHQ